MVAVAAGIISHVRGRGFESTISTSKNADFARFFGIGVLFWCRDGSGLTTNLDAGEHTVHRQRRLRALRFLNGGSLRTGSL